MFWPIFTVLPVATVIYSTTGSLSRQQSAVLLQILHNLKVHTLQFDVKFQLKHSMFTHTLLECERHGVDVSQNRWRGTAKKYLDCFIPVKKLFSGFIGILLLWSNHTNSNWSRIWLSRRPFCSSTRPNPLTTKMVVKPRTRSKRKKRWCSIPMQQWITWNCRQANCSRAFLLSIHPVYYSVLRLSSRDFRLPPQCGWGRSSGDVERLC